MRVLLQNFLPPSTVLHVIERTLVCITFARDQVLYMSRILAWVGYQRCFSILTDMDSYNSNAIKLCRPTIIKQFWQKNKHSKGSEMCLSTFEIANPQSQRAKRLCHVIHSCYSFFISPKTYCNTLDLNLSMV